MQLMKVKCEAHDKRNLLCLLDGLSPALSSVSLFFLLSFFSFSPPLSIFPPSLLSSLDVHCSSPSPASSSLHWQNKSSFRCGTRFCPFHPFLSPPPFFSLLFSSVFFCCLCSGNLNTYLPKTYSPLAKHGEQQEGGHWQEASLAFRGHWEPFQDRDSVCFGWLHFSFLFGFPELPPLVDYAF